MTDSGKSEHQDARDDRSDRDPVAMASFSYVLAAAWVFLPALQYWATFQRTSLQLDVNGVLDPTRVPLAVLDLTPYYLLLVALTGVFAAARYLAGRPTAPTGNTPHKSVHRHPRLENRS